MKISRIQSIWKLRLLSFRIFFFAKDWSDGFNRRGCSTSDSLVIPAQCMRISTLKYLKSSKKLQLQSWKNEIARCSNLWDFAMRLKWNDWQTTKLTSKARHVKWYRNWPSLRHSMDKLFNKRFRNLPVVDSVRISLRFLEGSHAKRPPRFLARRVFETSRGSLIRSRWRKHTPTQSLSPFSYEQKHPK